MIRYYTREAGVRNLERDIAKFAEKSLKIFYQKKTKKITVTARNIEKYLGVKKFRYGLAEEVDQVSDK